MPQHPSRRRSTRPGPALAFAVSATCLALCAGPIGAASIQDPEQGLVDLPPGATGVTELSGIAYAGGNLYYAVSDKGGRLFPLRIDVDPATGFVTQAVSEPARVLAGGIDLEGVALVDDDTVLVCDEQGSALREHRLADGVLLRNLQLPPIFRRTRPNLGIESLTRAEGAVWIANEEALRTDGDTASGTTGTRVRVQRLDRDGTPMGQWAYATDPHPGLPLFGRAYSGVADLLALPGGELLVLERSFSGLGFRARIYQVDFSGATRTDEFPSLEAASVVPLGKRRLWESRNFAANFEGLTVGPPLAAGDFSLMLVTDDSGNGPPALYPLRVRPGADLPATAPAVSPRED